MEPQTLGMILMIVSLTLTIMAPLTAFIVGVNRRKMEVLKYGRGVEMEKLKSEIDSLTERLNALEGVSRSERVK